MILAASYLILKYCYCHTWQFLISQKHPIFFILSYCKILFTNKQNIQQQNSNLDWPNTTTADKDLSKENSHDMTFVPMHHYIA